MDGEGRSPNAGERGAAGNSLPGGGELQAFLSERHGEALLIGTSEEKGGLRVVFSTRGKSRELLLVPYGAQLDRVAELGEFTGEDEAAARSLAMRLAAVHSARRFEPELYRLELRRDLDDFHGVLDPLTKEETLSHDEAAELAVKAARWWGRLRLRPQRLAALWGGRFPEGLWAAGGEVLLAGGSGATGEPAKEVADAAFLYLERALASAGRFAGPFRHLFFAFYGRYLETSKDDGLAAVLPFHLAWRALRAANDNRTEVDAGPRKRRYIDLASGCLDTDEFRVEELPDLLG